jgi:hypothetical protein
MLPLYFTRSLQPIHRSVKFKLSIARIHNARGQLRPSSRFIVQNDGLCDSLHGLAHLLAMPLQRLSRCPRVERRFLNRPRKIVFGNARQRDYRNEGNPQAGLASFPGSGNIVNCTGRLERRGALIDRKKIRCTPAGHNYHLRPSRFRAPF